MSGSLDTGPEFLHPVIFDDSRYEGDEDFSSSLLQQTCFEQQGRLRTLMLLSDYLATPPGSRKQQLLAGEWKALRELYESVWEELSSAFEERIVSDARAIVERSRTHERNIDHQELDHGQQSLF